MFTVTLSGPKVVVGKGDVRAEVADIGQADEEQFVRVKVPKSLVDLAAADMCSGFCRTEFLEGLEAEIERTLQQSGYDDLTPYVEDRLARLSRPIRA